MSGATGSACWHPPPQAGGAAGGSALPSLGHAGSERPDCGSCGTGGQQGLGCAVSPGQRGSRSPDMGVRQGLGCTARLGQRGPAPWRGSADATAPPRFAGQKETHPRSRAPLPGTALGAPGSLQAGSQGGCGQAGLAGAGLQAEAAAAGKEAARHRQCRFASPLPAGAGPAWPLRNAGGNGLHTHIFRREHIWRRAHLARGAAAAGARLTPVRVRGQGHTGATAHRAAASTWAVALKQGATASQTGRRGAGEGLERRHSWGAEAGQHHAEPAVPRAPSCSSTCTWALTRQGQGWHCAHTLPAEPLRLHLRRRTCRTGAGSGGIWSAEPRALPAGAVNPEGCGPDGHPSSHRHHSRCGPLQHDAGSPGTTQRQSSRTRAVHAASEGRTGGWRHRCSAHPGTASASHGETPGWIPTPVLGHAVATSVPPHPAATTLALPGPQPWHPHPQAGGSPAAAHRPHPCPRGCLSSWQSQAASVAGSLGTATALGMGTRAPLHAAATAGRRQPGPAGRPVGSVGGDAADSSAGTLKI